VDTTQHLRQSGLAAGLAAALCMAFSNIAFVAGGSTRSEALVWSAWLAGITLGLVWGAVFFGGMIGRRAAHGVTSRATQQATSS
jgi:hypothetical protein